VSDRRASIGILLEPRFAAPGEVLADLRRADLDRADILLAGDHTLGTPDPFALLAALATATPARIGTYVAPAATRHPAQVARLGLTLSGLAPGRFRLGVGSGWHREDFDAMGTEDSPRARRSMFEEHLTILRRLLDGAAVDHDGDHYRCRVDEPLAVGVDPPPLLVAASGSRMLRLACERADVVGLMPPLEPGQRSIHASSDITLAGFERKIEVIDAAPRHDLERSLLVPIVRFGDPGRLLGVFARAAGIDLADLVDSPFVLVDERDRLVDRIKGLAARYRIDELVFPEASMRRCPGLLADLQAA